MDWAERFPWGRVLWGFLGIALFSLKVLPHLGVPPEICLFMTKAATMAACVTIVVGFIANFRN